ncbi:splicing factor U2AF subunit isoform 2 [Cricetulus griseus]|uniref:Splicing factor U2AF subunit isoform 2 n=1 Tax=Cricetulus griseus TaxID=10029 RepID=A0A061HWI9_CRIGR|nr:splicing factor U2AF subunit isoform 2 [Cricetulus griseus]
MRWGNVPEAASATSCTYAPSPGTCAGSSTGGAPGIGHPQDPIQATVPGKGTDAVPQTTGMVASETGALGHHPRAGMLLLRTPFPEPPSQSPLPRAPFPEPPSRPSSIVSRVQNFMI